MRLFSFIQTTSVLFFYAAGTVAVNTPGAINIPFSQVWNGNDGNWSSFPLTVGTPPELVYVLPSTYSTATWVVGWMGCNESYLTTALPDNCAAARGGIFHNASSTWHDNGNWGLKAEEYLGTHVDGDFGFDDVYLGYLGAGVNVTNSTVAWFREEDFAVGMFGLSYRPTNFSIDASGVTPSYLTQLYDQKKIPALSYSYTAGAHYMQKSGSLVLGGYDKAKFVPNIVVFNFDENQSVDLSVGIKAITATNISSSNTSNLKIRDGTNTLDPSNVTTTASTTSKAQTTAASSSAASPTTAPAAIPSFTEQNLLPTPAKFFIDSTTSHIWLPDYACKMFEKAFGLVYDSATDLYLVNETQHDALVAQNSSITFSLTPDLGTLSPVVNITLPYAAFDLWVTWGYNITAPSRYFPIRRAANDSQFVLGRTFLQEAYLSVDNTNQNFTVSQRAWPYGGKSEILPGPVITKPLAPAIIAAIAVSGVALLTIIAFFTWFYFRRKRLAEEKKRKEEEEAEAARKAKEKEETMVPDPFATPDGVINELHTEKLETPELFGRLLPFNGAEVDGSHASERRYELGRGMEGIEGRHELEAPHGISQAPTPGPVSASESSESESERKSVDVTETEVSQRTETEGGSEGGSGAELASPMEPVSPESPGGSSRGLLGGEDPVSPQSPAPVKLQNDRHLIYGFF